MIVARNDTSTFARCNVDNGRAKYRSMLLYFVKKFPKVSLPRLVADRCILEKYENRLLQGKTPLFL